MSHIALARGELYYKLYIVGLYLGVMGGAATTDLAALGTTVNYNVALFGIGLGAYRLKQTAAFVCTVAGIHVNVN